MSKNEQLPQEMKAIADAHLSRRALIAGATGLGAAALIGGETLGAASAHAAGSPVRFGNWSLYLDYDNKAKNYPTLVEFTKKSGIPVKYMEVIDDNDSFTAKVTPQLRLKKDIGYDLVVPTEWMAARWLKAGFAQKLEAAAIPNKKNLISFLGKRDFDLNRDWAWQTQIESKQRVALYQQWYPQVVVDFHEQSYQQPYFFTPTSEPIHDAITSWQKVFQIKIGKNNYENKVEDTIYPRIIKE